jgi:nucleoside-diphosphate-sugar epimerase
VRALVTGAAGFVGRHMMTELREWGWDVVGVDLRHVPPRGGVLVTADVRDVFAGRLMADERFDLVVHCAYHVGGRAAIDGNPSLLALNLELDAQLFEWAVRTRQRAVMYFSSSAAYPVSLQQAGSTIRLAEDMIGRWPVQPDARYGWAKLTGERLAATAAEQGCRVHVLRPFSGYGIDQDNAYPFPAILARVLNGDMCVWGPPGQTRDWIHISDVVAGAAAVYRADYREPVNLCTGVVTEFGELAVMMAREVGVKVGHDKIIYLEDQPTGVSCRVGDPTRMLGIYQPQITIIDGIRMAIAGVER